MMKCSKCPAKKGVRLCEDDIPLCPNCLASPNKNTSKDSENISLVDIMTKLAVMGSDLAEVRDGQAHVVSSISFLSAKFDEMSKRLDELQTTNDGLKKTNDDLQNRVTKLEADVRNLELYSRRQNIEITNVPESSDENIDNIVMQVLSHVDATITPSDVDVTHRIGQSSEAKSKPRPIIVKFKSRRARDKIYERRKSLKDLKVKDLVGGMRGDGNVFINENLLPSTKDLLYKANLARKSKNYRYLWTSNGRVLVKKNADSPAILIASEADIAKIN